MKTEKVLVIAEQALEFAIGWTVGSVVHSTAKTKGCVDDILVTVGAGALAFIAGRAFCREFVKVCENKLDVDLKDRFV